MNFQNFDLEYFQSQFERTMEINLADSSVKCANVSDLLAGEDQRPLLEMPLSIPKSTARACCASGLPRFIRIHRRRTCW